MKNYNAKIRVNYNTIGVNIASGRNSKRLKGYDILDKSKQYYNSMLIAKTCNNTQYVKINNNYIKLKDYRIQLKKAHVKYYISSDLKYITRLDTMTTYNIIETNKMLIDGHKKDIALSHKLNNR
jgi:hypothetical protein